MLVETIFDTLNAKAALFGIDEAFEEAGVKLPIMISGTITDLPAAPCPARRRRRSGIRCATPGHFPSASIARSARAKCAPISPKSRASPTRSSAPIPTPACPMNSGSMTKARKPWPTLVGEFADSGLVNIVGGCCGTTPDHIAAIAEARRRRTPRDIPEIEPLLRLSGLEPFTLTSDINFVNIGERANVTGSAKFCKLIQAGDYAAALDIARDQVANGAQIIDVNMDEGLLDSQKVMVEFLHLVAAEPDIARVPVMVDSSKFEVIEAGLECLQGKAAVNRCCRRRVFSYGIARVVPGRWWMTPRAGGKQPNGCAPSSWPG